MNHGRRIRRRQAQANGESGIITRRREEVEEKVGLVGWNKGRSVKDHVRPGFNVVRSD